MVNSVAYSLQSRCKFNIFTVCVCVIGFCFTFTLVNNTSGPHATATGLSDPTTVAYHASCCTLL